MMNCNEVWKTIQGFEDYEVSNMGRVRNIADVDVLGRKRHRRILKPGLCSSGYYQVQLSNAGKPSRLLVHRLVASHFIPNPNNLPEVNHKQGVKTDNRASELEWVSVRENMSHRNKGCSSTYTGVTWFKPRNKWRAQISINGRKKHLGLFLEEVDAANAYLVALTKNNIQNKYAHATSNN